MLRFCTGSLLFISTACCLTAGCSDTTLATFSVDEDISEVRIPSIGIALPVPPVTVVLPSDLTAQQDLTDRRYDFISSAKLKKLTLRITAVSEDPASDNLEDGNLDDFDFLSMLEVHILSLIHI